MACGSDSLKCPDAPLVRDWHLVHIISANEAQPGRLQRADFRAIEPTCGGKIAHVRALRIRGFVRLAVGTSTNDFLTPYDVRALIHQIRLQDNAGHAFLDGFDGRSVVDYGFFQDGHFRTGERQDQGGLIQDVGAGSYLRPIDLQIDLAGRAPGSPQTRRLIPAAALQAADAQAFNFRLRGEFPFDVDGVAVDGYFRDEQLTPGLEVWADVVYLDTLVSGARWGVREYVRQERSGSFDYPDASHQFIVARYFREDDTDGAGHQNVYQIDGITLSVGGEPVLKGLPLTEVLSRDLLTVIQEPHSVASLPDGRFALPLAGPSGPAMLMLLPPRAYESSPAGRVNFRFSQAPEMGVRVLHAFTLCDQESRERKITKAVGIARPRTFQRMKDGTIVEGVVDPADEKFVKAG